MSEHDVIGFTKYDDPTHGTVYGCRGIGDKYATFYNKWLTGRSYKCVRFDFPWDYFIFEDPLDEKDFISEYYKKYGESEAQYLLDNLEEYTDSPNHPYASGAMLRAVMHLLKEKVKEESIEKEIESEIVRAFSEELSASQVDLPEDFQKVLDENFWDLLDIDDEPG